MHKHQDPGKVQFTGAPPPCKTSIGEAIATGDDSQVRDSIGGRR
jgi:hypothetical protein